MSVLHFLQNNNGNNNNKTNRYKKVNADFIWAVKDLHKSSFKSLIIDFHFEMCGNHTRALACNRSSTVSYQCNDPLSQH